MTHTIEVSKNVCASMLGQPSTIDPPVLRAPARPPQSRPGFTLIELLVVVAVIAILAGILFPVFAQAREQARKSACLSNEKQIALAVSMYRQDWDGVGPFAGWPPGPQWQYNVHVPGSHYEFEWQFTIQPYLKSGAVLRCASDRTPFDERSVSYVYNEMMSFDRMPYSEAGVERPAEVVVLWEGYGPIWSATMKNPPPVSGIQFPASMYREYSVWGNHAQYLVDPARSLPHHNGGGNAIYMDLHARWLGYGQGSSRKELIASVEQAFSYATAVAPSPPLPSPKSTGLNGWDW